MDAPSGAEHVCLPGSSDVDLFRSCDSIVDLDAEVSNGTFESVYGQEGAREAIWSKRLRAKASSSNHQLVRQRYKPPQSQNDQPCTKSPQLLLRAQPVTATHEMLKLE